MIKINGLELTGELITASDFGIGFGVFTILSKGSILFPSTMPHYTLYKTKELPDNPAYIDIKGTGDEKVFGEAVISGEVVISLDIEYRLDLLRLSILTLQSQFLRYTTNDYEAYLFGILEEADRVLCTRGAILLENEFAANFTEICGSLLESLDNLDTFYTGYLELIKRLSPEYEVEFRTAVNKPAFINATIKQHIGKNSDGFEYQMALLSAAWVKPIIKAMWRGDLAHRANKMPKLHRSFNDMALDLAHVDLCLDPEESKIRGEGIWVDFSAQLTAGLSPKLINAVLKQHNKSTVIDLIKLFTSLWNENPDIQRRGSFNIPTRWAGLLDQLHTRYGVSKSDANKMNVINSCRLLEAIRWGSDWSDHEKLIAFGGRKKNDQLIVTYLEGFTKPLYEHERLVPILNHPSGIKRSRPVYNRLGLAIGSWLVEHSHAYFNSGGLGVRLDDAAYDYFQQKVGYSRKDKLKTDLKKFEKYGAVTLENGLLGLGEANAEGKKLIIEGEKKSMRGVKMGRASANSRQNKSKKKD